jgi:hypothetical protein
MIRTTMTMLAVGFLTLSGVSAMAAPKASHPTSHHQNKVATVAEAGSAAPAADAAKPTKKAKKAKVSQGGKDKMKNKAPGIEAPAATPAPEKK